jgi:hypothetical protein
MVPIGNVKKKKKKLKMLYKERGHSSSKVNSQALE